MCCFFVSMAISILDCLDVFTCYISAHFFCHHKPAQMISKLLLVMIPGIRMLYDVCGHMFFFGSFTIEVQTFAINHPRFQSLAFKHSPDATVF